MSYFFFLLPRLLASVQSDQAHRSSRFGADIPGPWSLGRGFFVEADSLSFIQLIEVPDFHRAPVEKPLLTAVVTDESEPPIAHQPFDRAVRHVDYLRGPCRVQRSAFVTAGSVNRNQTTLTMFEIKFRSRACWRSGQPPAPTRRRLEKAGRRLKREHSR